MSCGLGTVGRSRAHALAADSCRRIAKDTAPALCHSATLPSKANQRAQSSELGSRDSTIYFKHAAKINLLIAPVSAKEEELPPPTQKVLYLSFLLVFRVLAWPPNSLACSFIQKKPKIRSRSWIRNFVCVKEVQFSAGSRDSRQFMRLTFSHFQE